MLVLGLLLCGSSSALRACNVPAFRYALERWPADLYQVVVYHESTLPGGELELLRKSAAGQGGLANYSLRTVDVSRPEGMALARQRRIAAFPWVEIFYPAHSEIEAAVWSGPLASGCAGKIVASRNRARLAESLLSGEVAVWVVVRGGNERKNRRAVDVLKASLAQASATLRIPEIGTDLNGDPIVVTDFKTYPVHFALMEIAADDAGEELLVSALLKSEPDLEQYDEPKAFPVFGRGRALYALVGEGIQEKNILEACQSLINWCSCEIKALNPGTDLLIAADWSRPFGGRMVKDPEVPLVGLGGFVPGQAPGRSEPAQKAVQTDPGPAACVVAPPAARTTLTAAAAQAPAPLRRPLRRNLLYLAGGAGIALLALSVLLAVRKKR